MGEVDGNKNRKPIAVDLFSGAGGLSQGLKMAGFDIRLAVESEIDPCVTYMENNPGIPVICKPIQDIPNFKFFVKRIAHDGEKIDLVAGGPPCQGFSHANTRNRGEENDHSQLVWNFYRAVKQMEPRAFLMENVPGIKSTKDRRVVSDLLSDFDSLGYEVSEMQVLASEYGVPQNRRRFFLVGSKGGRIDPPKPTHGDEGRHPFVTVGDAIMGDLPRLDNNNGVKYGEYSSEPTSEYQRWLRKGSPGLSDHMTTKTGSLVNERFQRIKPGGNLNKLMASGELPEWLKIRIDHGGVYHRLELDKPSYTIVNFRKAMIIHPIENRLLTLREAARLQSFRDVVRFRGQISFMQQMIGDSVPPLLAKALSKPICNQLLE